MAKTPNRHTIPGSERSALPGARAAGPVLPDERIEVSVRVRPRPGQRDLGDGGALADQPPAQRQYLSRDEYASRHGAAAADIAKVKAFAKAHQLAVVEASAARRTVVLSGTAAALGQAFGTTLRQFQHDGGTYRGRTGALSVPGDLAGIIEGVFGLDNRPQASPHFQVLGADGKPHVDFPASSPFALGCGGTLLAASGSTISSEVVWNENAKTSATGGGVSGFFPIPAYQKTAKVPPVAGSKKTGRGVPDVAGDADPNSGYRVRVDGQSLVIGGTSAVAPLWAGLIALLNQKLGKPVGYLNPLLYGSLMGTGAFRDVVSGNNGSYSAAKGWDPCTGWGSPVGSKLLLGLGAKPTRKPVSKKSAKPRR